MQRHDIFNTKVIGERGSKGKTRLTMSSLLKLNNRYIKVHYTLPSTLG